MLATSSKTMKGSANFFNSRSHSEIAACFVSSLGPYLLSLVAASSDVSPLWISISGSCSFSCSSCKLKRCSLYVRLEDRSTPLMPCDVAWSLSILAMPCLISDEERTGKGCHSQCTKRQGLDTCIATEQHHRNNRGGKGIGDHIRR